MEVRGCSGRQLFGNGLIGHIAGPRAHIYDTALGLVASGDGGCGGSGVRAERSAVVGGHAAHGGEAGEAQVGLGHSTVVVHGALVEAGRLDLGSAHAVADEQEDVLGFSGTGPAGSSPRRLRHPHPAVLRLRQRVQQPSCRRQKQLRQT